MMKFLKLFGCFFMAATLLCATALADTPGRHPAYIHALADLRSARALLMTQTGNYRVNADQQQAVSDIDSAMHMLREAAIDDGKPLGDHPPMDSRWTGGDRLHRALELLTQARQDIDHRESDSFARGLKHRSLHQLDDACKAVRHGIKVQGKE